MGPELENSEIRTDNKGSGAARLPVAELRQDSPFYLNREGLVLNEQFLMSADILRKGDRYQPAAELLIERILELGGRVAIITAGSDGPTAEIQPTNDKIAQLQSRFGAERLSTIYLEPPESAPGSKIWIRDYLGCFVPHREDRSSFRYLHSNTPHEGHWSRKWQYEDVLAKIEGAEIVIPDLPIVGGDFALLGDDTLLLTKGFKSGRVDHVIDSTPEAQLKKLQATADLMGRPNILFIPSPFTNINHADCIACQVDSTVFIPEIPDECLSLSPYTRSIERARAALSELKSTLKEKGFSVETLPMGLPGIDVIEVEGKILSAQCESRDCLLPCNLIQFRNSDGELHVLVPWNIVRESDDKIENPSSQYYPKYQVEIEAKLKKAGAKSVTFIPFSAPASGGLHCITKSVPDEIAAILNSQLGTPDSPSRLQASHTKLQTTPTAPSQLS